ncbi:MAG TPA: nickel-dependent lactate racemase [Armatimonadota bacterium]|jgi:nickel-dependent lactate racemase
MQIDLHYGKTGLPLELPDEWDVTVFRKTAMPVLDDPQAALQRAVREPIGGEPLSVAAARARTACILICDVTRPVPNGTLLPILVRTLLAAGIAAEQITILVATGFHRPNEGEELREVVGDDWVLATVPVCNHFARNDEDHRLLGVTQRGTPAKLDRRFVDADLRIVVGLVEPHFMAGYSGGRKLITPGIAHADTIASVHSAAFLEHPCAANCRLQGNPLHDTQLEIARMVGPVYAVNTVLDEARRISYLSYGELEASHQAAIEFLTPYATFPIETTFSTVITTGAGYPLDKTYYQTVKGIVSAHELLTPGGMLFIASECSEGLGSPEFISAQEQLLRLGSEDFLAMIVAQTRANIDEWQTEMLIKALHRGTLCLYSTGLTAEEQRLTGVTCVPSLADAVRQRVAATGNRRIAVIPEGPYLIPLALQAAQLAYGV